MNFVRTVRRSHSTEYTIFQLARKTLSHHSSTAARIKFVQWIKWKQCEQKEREREKVKKDYGKKEKLSNLSPSTKTESVHFQCERIQETATLLRIESAGSDGTGWWKMCSVCMVACLACLFVRVTKSTV